MSTIFTARAARCVRAGLGCCLLFVALDLSIVHSQPPPASSGQAMPGFPGTPIKSAKPPVEPGAVEVAFADGSNLKLQLRDEKIALDTPHGKLLIAVTDIQRIEFATRVSDEDAKRIQTAIAELGSSEFGKREAASAQLLKLREKAYPAILDAAKQKDREVVRRAQELIQQITASVPAEQLVVRPKDVIHTADSTIAGRIEGGSLKAHTSQFGAVQVKLADVRSLRSQAIQTEGPATMNMSFDPMQKLQMEAIRRQRQMEIMQRKMQEMKK